MKTYYYTDGKTNYGPFTIEELKVKSLTHETFVWTDSFAEWKKLKDVPELRELTVVLPPPIRHEQNSSRRFIDVLLFCSLVYWLIDYLILNLLPAVGNSLNVAPMKFYPYVQVVLRTIFAAIPVIVACSIQNKLLKIIALIISVFIAVISIASGMAVFIRTLKYSSI